MSTAIQNSEQSTENTQTRLLSEFPYSTYADWREAALKLLKGAPFEKKLCTKTYEGITLQPIYMQQDIEGLTHIDSLPGFAPYLRGGNVLGSKVDSWKVAQEIPYGTPEEFNKALRHDLERGQTAVNLLLDKATRLELDPDQAQPGDVGQEGVSIATLEDLEKALKGVNLEDIPIFVQAGLAALPFAALFAAFMQKHHRSLENVCGYIAMDPLTTLVCEGRLPFSLNAAYTMMADLTSWVRHHAPRLGAIVAQGYPYHNSGGNVVQELAFVVATAVEYLREMLKRGLAIDEVAPRIRFGFSIGSTYFMEIAKLRAARIVWAKAVKAFGGSTISQKMVLHVRTALWNKTIYDPYVNMLRTTVEAFAGVIGGCDSMHVGCFDEPVRLPDEFCRRIARNTQTILQQEAYLNEVVDPAGGAWFVEKLTDEVARKAWKLFQEVEQKGGMAKALESGFPQEQVKQTASERIANLATRKDVLIGTNRYPNLSEKLLESDDFKGDSVYQERVGYIKNYRHALPENGGFSSGSLAQTGTFEGYSSLDTMAALIKGASSGASLGALSKALYVDGDMTPKVEPVQLHRGAEMFETLRSATETYKANTGARPKVFLANMGPLPQHKARADFSTEFFEVGGFEVISTEGFATIAEAASAAIDSDASVVVICSTDATYPELVPPLTRKIKAAKPETMVILAGYPTDHIEAFQEAGVDEFIHIRANLYSIFVNLLKKFGMLA